MKSLMFLCSGNYYRSRFAEIFFNWHADQRGLAWKAFSRGLALDDRNPGAMSRYTLDRLNAKNIDHVPYDRMPQDVADEDFEKADHVVAVKQTEHHSMILRRFAPWLEHVEFWEVHDLDCSGPDEALDHLEREVLALVERLEKEAAAS